MEFKTVMEKIIGKLLLNLDFRQQLLTNPRLVLAQEGLSPVEVTAVLPHLTQLTNQQLNTIDDNLVPLAVWLA